MNAEIKEKLTDLLQQAEYALFEARNLMSGYDDSAAMEIQDVRRMVEGLMRDHSVEVCKPTNSMC